MASTSITSIVDARNYYAHLADPERNFNEVEVTLSHIFRDRSAGLNNRNFSEALLRFLDEQDLVTDDIMEIGCGLGDIARNLLVALAHNGRRLPVYSLVDISPALLTVQRSKLHNFPVAFIEADATALPNPDQSVGFVLSVGMLADLPSILIDPGTPDLASLPNDEDRAFARLVFEQHGPKEPFYLHVGSGRFLRDVHRILRPGAAALIMEYGATLLNCISDFGDHFECGITFSHLMALAEDIGFDCQLLEMSQVIGLDPAARFLSIDFFTRLRLMVHRVPTLLKLGREGQLLTTRAYTYSELQQELERRLGVQQSVEAARTFEPYFFSLYDSRFDTKNPDTWAYKAMLLRKG